MFHYTIETLSNPATYAADQELTRIARQAATRNYEKMGRGNMGMGEFKAHVAHGEYPQIVFDELELINNELIAHGWNLENARVICESLKLPAGWSVSATIDAIHLSGPYDEDMIPRLGRIGHWDREKKYWVIAHEKAVSLKRVFGNAEKSAAEKKALADAAKSQRAAEKLKRDAEKRAEAERIHYAQLEQEKARQKAISERVKVPVGKYKIGDTIRTTKCGEKTITSFGKSWTEDGKWVQVTDENSSAYGFQPGQDWYPRVKIGNGGTFCYAYFD